MKRTALLTLAGLLLVGCVGPTWVTDNSQPQEAKAIAVSASLPQGWARYSPDPDLVMTRDGLLLETIRVSRKAYGSKLENTDRKFTKGIDAQEAAQILIDAFAADKNRHNLQVVDNRPVAIDGHAGFALEVTYRTPEGLTIRETMYVALVGDSYVIARFTAPDRHYHELHKGAFEEVVKTLKIAPKTFPKP